VGPPFPVISRIGDPMDISIYEHLSRIKVIDEKILKLQRQKAQTPQEIIDLKKKISQTEGDLKIKEKRFKEESTKLHNVSGVITAEKDKLSKSEIKLPQVKNSKEYQAVTKEITQAKKTISQLEEQEKTQTIALGEVEKVFQAVKTEFENTSREYEKKMVDYKDKSNSVEMDIKDLHEERSKQLETLPEKVRKQYELLYTKLAANPLAGVESGRCTMCNMVISPQIVNCLLQCEDIQRCNYCQRILIKQVEAK
jgi:uncharacterized protein